MQRIISQYLSIQQKFISRYMKVHQHEMVLYNERPQTSLVVRFDEDKNNELYHSGEIKDIRSNSSKTVSSTNTNYIVLHTNSGRINIPVIEERIDSEETPAITFVDIVKWLAKTPDSDNTDPVQPGARVGRLDAANEAGFFHRTNSSRLREVKKKSQDKINTEPTEPKRSG